MARDHVPGMAIAVFHNGMASLDYCGIANESSQTPVGPDTIFQAASLGKPVFAYAVLSLAHEKKFDLDRPLVEYLGGSYKHRQRPFTALSDTDGPTDTQKDKRFAKITARMVLSHTAGLPNWANGKPLVLIADPGKDFHYSGEGYILLQRAVEAATHQSLEQVVQERVFTPLHMAHSSFLATDSEAAAQGYGRDGKLQNVPLRAPLAPTSLRTTLADYVNFLDALLVLPQDVSPFGQMRLARIVAAAKLHVAWGYGLGLEDVHDRLTIFHMGSNPGFYSFFALEPETGDGALFFTNSENGAVLTGPVAQHYLPGHHPMLDFPLLHPND